MKYFTNSSGYDSRKNFKGYSYETAKKKRDDIYSAANTEDIYEIKGTKHYISKNQKLENIPTNLQPGDALLFERGGIWRVGGNSLNVPNGVILGAYGVGDKPKFYGSVNNYAKNSLWEKENANVWKTKIPFGNVGIMVFDHSAALGVKKWNYKDIKVNYDFYYDYESSYLYFYYNSDIESDFESIEIGARGDIIILNSNTIADNICVKYTGSHGIVLPTGTENVIITNCEVGFIGGSCQFKETRFGNGIEMQLGAKNILIKDNWVYQCYDAGITFQSWSGPKKETFYENIKVLGNLIDFCFYGFEFFTTTMEKDGVYSEIRNVNIDDNIFRFSGYAWCYEQRPDHWMNSHIRSRMFGYIEPTYNLSFRNNIFDCSRASIVFWWWHDPENNYIHPNPHPGVIVDGNSFYQAPLPDGRCMSYYTAELVLADNLPELIKAVLIFDSNPKEVIWLNRIG